MKKKQTLILLIPILAALLSVLIFSHPAYAQGGPPMLTDDPATPGDRMWEINFLTTLDRSREGWDFETPIVDINYGFGNDIQIKLEAPWIITKKEGEVARSGLGNSMVGIKWRFIDEEAHGFDMSIYPQLEFNNPTQSVERGLVDKGARLFLPVEAATKFGSVDVTGELGYGLVQHGMDEWEYGVLFARSLTTRIELLGELHGSALSGFGEDELLFNMGSRVQISKNAVVLFSAGRTIRNADGQGPHNIAALGIQFNFMNRMPRFMRSR